MEWCLYQQQKWFRKTSKQQNQTVKNHRKSFSEKSVLIGGVQTKKIFFIQRNIDYSQFSLANRNETHFSAMVKTLHKAGNSTHSEVEETLEFQKTLQQKTSNLSNLQTFLKMVIGTVKFTTLQYCLLYNKKRKNLQFI